MTQGWQKGRKAKIILPFCLCLCWCLLAFAYCLSKKWTLNWTFSKHSYLITKLAVTAFK
jgi:hypothetical protein